MIFKPGDPVRLAPAYAAALDASPQARGDWANRRGVVHRARRGSPTVFVLWAGNRWPEGYLLKAVEKIEP